ncbi:DUF418 domain-containing protein [Flavobacterium sp.]|uniref:DUF418 domain-containing protein n=1 Tax=Flavobacterium sp. TaxID=239 RepID=UPI002CEC18D0|nr:DUF418 domain-containing protein [Flavobacterium sp.]HSD06303.1 DUF418 domain-containing protein [Flavobacterium sp.]
MTKPIPSDPNQRIEVLDALRGFALLGIILANILSWSGIKFMPFTQIKQWPNLNVDQFVYQLNGFFVDTKFYTIFSLLFGMGFYIQFNKNRNNQESFMKMYYRRLSFLMLFGLIHTFFWSGDILFIYALVGFVFVQFRNFETKKLLVIAAIAFIIPIFTNIFMLYYSPGFMVSEQRLALHTYADLTPADVIAPFQHGTFWEVTKANFHHVLWRYFDLMPAGRLFKIFAFFIVGFCMMDSNYFSKKSTSITLMLTYLSVGLVLTYTAKQITGSMAEFPSNWNDILYKIISSFGQVSLSFSYISLLSMLYESNLGKKVMVGLKYVGRMSFSSYLCQTIFGIIIFYPYALGYYATMTLWQVELLGIGIYLVQIVIAVVWLKYFTFGPLEWLWRSLTYGRFLSMRKNKIISEKPNIPSPTNS